MTLVGALLIFGERLNLYQWIGVLLAVVSFFMLSRSGKKEGISFEHNRWVWFVVLAALLGAISTVRQIPDGNVQQHGGAGLV